MRLSFADARDMDEDALAFERAAAALADPRARVDAERALLDFRARANASRVAQSVLAHSGNVDAQFQAANCFRAATLREWGGMGEKERAAHREFALRWTLARAGAPTVVRNQMSSTTATLVKRACVDADDGAKMAVLGACERDVREASEAVGATSDARTIGLEVFAAVVSEFAPGTASELGTTWERHERCRTSAEKHFLKPFFVHGCEAAKACVASGSVNDGSDHGACAAALRLMNAVLSWDFNRDVSYGFRGRSFPSTESAANAFVKLTPGIEWRDVLLNPGALDWLYDLHASAESAVLAGGGDEAKRVAAASRKTLSALCTLSGCVFPSSGTDDALRVGHFVRCARAIAKYLLPASTSVRAALEGHGEDALIDGCRSMSALATVHAARDFANVSLGPELNNRSALDLLGELTLECLNQDALSVHCEGAVVDDCLKMLLEAWASLVNKGMGAPGGADTVGVVPVAVLEGAAKISQAYVFAGLKAAREGAHEEDDGHEEEGKAGAAALDARLELAAQVLRAHPTSTLPMLQQALIEKRTALPACVASGQDPSELLEELWWLTRLIAHVLADDGDGETPIPPDSLAAASAATAAGASDCVVELARALLDFGCLALDANARGALSPRLLETIIWGLARWADTYLIPEDSGGSLHAAVYAAAGGVRRGADIANKLAASGGGMFSEANGGVQALDLLVQIGTKALSDWSGETSLQKTAGFVLFPVLTRRKTLLKHLVTLPSWATLRQACAGAHRERGIVAFPPEVHRGLSECVGRVAASIPDPAECEAYVTSLISPPGEVLAAVSVDTVGLHHPEGEARACAALEALRGIVRATNGKSQGPIFNFFSTAVDHLINLQILAKDLARVTKLLLRLTEEFVEMNSPYLNAQQVDWVCKYCLRVIETYAQSGRGNVKADVGAVSSEDAVKEAYKEVRALLRMLTHLSSGNLHDAIVESAPPDQAARLAEQIDIARVVFAGLDAVIPLITDELLKFPKLCRQYFELLAYMLEAYPKKVAQLPGHLFGTLMTTLEFGLKHANETVSKESMTALSALSTFQCNSVKARNEGLGAHMAPNAEGLSILAHLMRVLFHRLIYEEAVFDLVDEAADALLPIILHERRAFENLASSLVTTASNEPRSAELVQNAFVGLTTANNLSEGVDRMNKRRFRRNLADFLVVARGVLRRR